MPSISRRALALGAATALIGLSACSAEIGDDVAANTDPPRVAYIANTQADWFEVWLADEMKNQAAQLHKTFELEIFDGEADDEVQNRLIEQAGTDKFDALIVRASDFEVQASYLEDAIRAGIFTIMDDPRADALVVGGYTVGEDPYFQGANIAGLALEDVPLEAKVVVLNGPGGDYYSETLRRAWEDEFFHRRADVTIIAEGVANWSKDEASALMKDWAKTHPQIDVIISMNDDMALGALEAVEGKKILAYGIGGSPEVVQLIETGTMTATSAENAETLAGEYLDTVDHLLAGDDVIAHQGVSASLITRENAQEYIDMYREAGLLKK